MDIRKGRESGDEGRGESGKDGRVFNERKESMERESQINRLKVKILLKKEEEEITWRGSMKKFKM